MNRSQAVYKWFNGFMPSYRDTSIVSDKDMELADPRLVYTYTYNGVAFEQSNITASIWHKTESESKCDELAEQFRKYILEHDIIDYDDGSVLVMPGTPFCQSLNDASKELWKRRYINLIFEEL